MSPKLTFGQLIAELELELEDVTRELRNVNREDLTAEQYDTLGYQIARLHEQWTRIMGKRDHERPTH